MGSKCPMLACSVLGCFRQSTCSFTSASSSVHRNKPFLVGPPRCLSTWDPGQTETPESLLSGCLVSAQQVKTLCSLLAGGFSLNCLVYAFPLLHSHLAFLELGTNQFHTFLSLLAVYFGLLQIHVYSSPQQRGLIIG